MNNSIIYNSPKKDKLTEKAFMHSITVSVISILFCIVALCSATFAWFSMDISSSSNTIKTGNCTVTVVVTADNGIEELTPDANGMYTFVSGKYNISITSEGTVQSSYCIFYVGDDKYYTEQISTVEPDNKISFSISFTERTEVRIETRWGTFNTPNNDRDLFDGYAYNDMNKVAE